MDAGAEVSWDKKYSRKKGEISGIQHAMEWYIGKPSAFWSELQNEPERENSGKGWWNSKQIAAKELHTQRAVVPDETHRIVCHIDLHEDVLYWACLALTEHGSGTFIDYDTYPKQKRRYFQKSQATNTLRKAHPKIGKDGAISKGLSVLIAGDGKRWPGLLKKLWVGESGQHYLATLLGCDRGHKPKIVDNVFSVLERTHPEFRTRLVSTRGIGVGPSDTPLGERRKRDGEQRYNNSYISKREKNKAAVFWLDTNYWKEEANDRWATPLGEIGCLSLFHAGTKWDHQLFSEHQTSETGTEVSGRGRTLYVFDEGPADNHYYDNAVDCLAMGSVVGCDTPATKVNPPPPPPSTKRPKRSGRKIKGL